LRSISTEQESGFGICSQKIEPVPEDRRFILTIPGVGYRFTDKAEG